MNWQGHDHLDEFHAGYLKQPVKGGSVMLMTNVTVFYVTMLRIVTDHLFFSYIWKPLNDCVDTFSVMQLCVL